MTKTLPSYLRVHRDSDSPIQATATAQPSIDTIDGFWHQFSDATGWQLSRHERSRRDSIDLLPVVGDVDLGSVLADDEEAAIIDAAAHLPQAPHHWASSDSHPGPPSSPGVSESGIGRAAATSLAEAAQAMADELTASREMLKTQSMELAARASVITGEGGAQSLAEAIETIMADAVMACGCDAAALYLLDDDTRVLSTRAVFGLPADRLQQPPRELRGSRGDLEAMVRDVVTIDDFAAGSIDTWNPPEAFAAGICVVIKSADVPIGTLWLFAAAPTTFTRAQSAAARLAAGGIAARLQSAAATRQTQAKTQAAAVTSQIADWQYQTLPLGVRVADDFRVDGMIESPADWATGWHTWDVLPDGTLMIAIAEAVDRSITGAMIASVARSAFTSHAGYRHTPVQMLARISDTLWQTSSGEQLLSMMYAHVDPETGEGEVASAGNITAMIANRYGYRPLVDGLSEPLNMHIDARATTDTFRLLPGETLLAHTAGLTQDGASQLIIGQQLRNSIRQNDPNALAAIRRAMADMPLKNERGAVAMRRE